jgi:GT2 family glycosyltransferase
MSDMLTHAAAQPFASARPLIGAGEVAVVAIGRNEGERMVRCIEAALGQVSGPGAVVYVDSGSTDGSLERADELGATAIELQPRDKFTAAKARNFGWSYVRRHLPDVRLIQFLDADCEIMPGWIETARGKLQEDPRVAGVAGVLCERFRDATIYNRLCDMEWQSPSGEALAVGGNAMYRVEALEEVGGFDPSLIAGEEPELCLRLREKGWKLWRLPVPMAVHDAAMTRFTQWWRRAVRFGYAQTEVTLLHRHSLKRIWARETRSTVAWAVGPPLLTAVAVLVLASTAGGWWWLLGLLPLELYDALFLKVYSSRRRAGAPAGDAALYAAAVTVAKIPQFIGLVRYLLNRLQGKGPRLIEYKSPPVAGAAEAGR